MSQDLVQITRPQNYISRSAILTFKKCDYKGFLKYFFEGYGLDSEKQSLDLLIGSVTHRGRQYLLEHCRVHHTDGNFDAQCIDEAVASAYELWNAELSKRELWLHRGEENRLGEIIAEQECLFEGLIRAWAARRLPEILDEYIILEVEQEEVFENFSAFVTWLGKADAMFLRKSDGAVILDSFKTASTFPEVTERNILHDMQGISEWVAAEDRLERYWKDIKGFMFQDSMTLDLANKSSLPKWMQIKLALDEEAAIKYFMWLAKLSSPPKIHGVQYDFGLKGQRKKENYKDPSLPYLQNSFLCHPYKKDSLVIFTGSGFSQGTDEYRWCNKKQGPMGKGWNKINIWEDIGTKTWVEMLATGQVQPEEGDPFLVQFDEKGKIVSGVLHTPPMVVRNEFEKSEWLISTRFYSERLFEYKEMLQSISVEAFGDSPELIKEYEQTLWQLFPKNTLSCHDFYGKDCEFVVHCHEMMGLQELEQSGYFSRRIPHHDDEKEMFIEKGYIADE
jgi:hypothetical protein